MKHAIDVGPFNELADPRVVARLAARAEERGWDGFFVWDHIVYSASWSLIHSSIHYKAITSMTILQ